jgi:hypothetical protein
MDMHSFLAALPSGLPYALEIRVRRSLARWARKNTPAWRSAPPDITSTRSTPEGRRAMGNRQGPRSFRRIHERLGRRQGCSSSHGLRSRDVPATCWQLIVAYPRSLVRSRCPTIRDALASPSSKGGSSCADR